MAYNKLPLKERLLNKAIRSGDCLLWAGAKHPRGWGVIRENGKWIKAYRASYKVHYGEIPDGLVVMHSCDNPACIEPSHLSLGAQRDNIADMRAKGRVNKPRGMDNPRAKLTDQQVSEIRQRFVRYDRLNGARAIARDYGVSKTAIQHIISGKNWSHIPGGMR